MSKSTITNIIVRDIRFPTSLTLDGSDAVNVDPDYSATYIVLETDGTRGLRGLCEGAATPRRSFSSI